MGSPSWLTASAADCSFLAPLPLGCSLVQSLSFSGCWASDSYRPSHMPASCLRCSPFPRALGRLLTPSRPSLSPQPLPCFLSVYSLPLRWPTSFPSSALAGKLPAPSPEPWCLEHILNKGANEMLCSKPMFRGWEEEGWAGFSLLSSLPSPVHQGSGQFNMHHNG